MQTRLYNLPEVYEDYFYKRKDNRYKGALKHLDSFEHKNDTS